MTATAGPNRAAMGTAATPSSSTDLPLPGVLTMGGPSQTPGDTTTIPTTPGTTPTAIPATDSAGTNRAGRGPTTTGPSSCDSTSLMVRGPSGESRHDAGNDRAGPFGAGDARSVSQEGGVDGAGTYNGRDAPPGAGDDRPSGAAAHNGP